MKNENLERYIKRTVIEEGLRYGCRHVKDDNVITRPHKYEGIEEYLYFIMDNRTQNITKSLLENWDISVEDAFKFAERNTDSDIVMKAAEKLIDRHTL